MNLILNLTEILKQTSLNVNREKKLVNREACSPLSRNKIKFFSGEEFGLSFLFEIM